MLDKLHLIQSSKEHLDMDDARDWITSTIAIMWHVGQMNQHGPIHDELFEKFIDVKKRSFKCGGPKLHR